MMYSVKKQKQNSYKAIFSLHNFCLLIIFTSPCDPEIDISKISERFNSSQKVRKMTEEGEGFHYGKTFNV